MTGPTGFDLLLMAFYNRLVGVSPAFDLLVVGIVGNNLLKGATLMAGFWWLWFGAGPGGDAERRRRLLVVLLGALASEVLAVYLSHHLPFRPRPLFVAGTGFRLPGDIVSQVPEWGKSSSFPSDHATLFCGLAAALVFVARRAGLVLLAYTAVIIVFPRLYVGYHYPTDVLAGALIGGFGTAGALALYTWVAPIRRPVVALFGHACRHPALLYSALFLLSFEVGELFAGARQLLASMRALVHLAG